MALKKDYNYKGLEAKDAYIKIWSINSYDVIKEEVKSETNLIETTIEKWESIPDSLILFDAKVNEAYETKYPVHPYYVEEEIEWINYLCYMLNISTTATEFNKYFRTEVELDVYTTDKKEHLLDEYQIEFDLSDDSKMNRAWLYWKIKSLESFSNSIDC